MKVLKFGAVWCSGCLVMKPRWVEIEKELPWLETEYYDIDEEKDFVRKYSITDYLCFIFIDKSGNEIHKVVKFIRWYNYFNYWNYFDCKARIINVCIDI